MKSFNIEYRIYGIDTFDGEGKEAAIENFFNSISVSNWKVEIDKVEEAA